MKSSCPRPDKVPYVSRASALRARRRIRQQRASGAQELIAYQCECTCWHLGRNSRHWR